MLIRKDTSIVIASTPEAIWEYAYDPDNWTASNPEDHRGLTFFNASNRTETGVAFHQKEYVARFYADLRGQILWAERPRVGGEQAVYDHTYRELIYFRKRLERHGVNVTGVS